MSFIKQSFINSLLSDIDILRIIEPHVVLKKKGIHYFGLSPFNEESTPSFCVNKGKQRFNDYSSGKSGNAVTFLMEFSNLTFIQAIEEIAKIYSIPVEYENPEISKKYAEKTKKKTELRPLLNSTLHHYQQTLKELPEDHQALKEIAFRNYDNQTVIDWQIGFAPGQKFIYNKIAKIKSEKEALELGIISEKDNRFYDKYYNRLVYPIHDENGLLLGFSGRDLSGKKTAAKWINPKQNILYEKDKIWFGLHRAKKAIIKKNEAWIVEGYNDVISWQINGVENTIAPCGTSITENQIKRLKRLCDSVILAMDDDKAGKKAIIKYIPILLAHGFSVHVFDLCGCDPDSFTRLYKQTLEKEPLTALTDSFEQKTEGFTYLLDYYIADKKGSENKEDLILLNQHTKQLCNVISSVPDEATREAYTGWLVKQSGIIKSTVVKWLKEYQKESEPEENETYKKYVMPIEVKKSFEYFEDDILKYGLFQANNQIWMLMSGTNKSFFTSVSNFSIEVIQHMMDEQMPMKLIKIQNVYNEKAIFDTPSHSINTPQSFDTMVTNHGRFDFTGSSAQHRKLRSYLMDKMGTGRKIETLGWQTEGFWCWNNKIIIPNQDEIVIDENGVFKFEDTSYYVPSANQIYKNNPTKFVSQKLFKELKAKVTFNEFSTQMQIVHKEHAIASIIYSVACIFRDIVISQLGNFPILFFYGPAGTGKDELAKACKNMFGVPQIALNLESKRSTAKAEVREFAQFSNGMVHLSEYVRGDADGMLKGIWDNSGYKRSQRDSHVANDSIPILSGVILTGNEHPDKEPVITRFLWVEFSKNEFTIKDAEEFEKLEKMINDGFSSFTSEIIHFRAKYKAEFNKQHKIYKKKYTSLFNGIHGRVVHNLAILGATYEILKDHIDFSFTFGEMNEQFKNMVAKQQRKLDTTSVTNKFWDCFIASTRGSFADQIHVNRDYKLQGSRLSFNFTNVFNKIQRQWRSQYSENSPFKAVMLDVLKKQDSFVELKKNIRIGGVQTSGIIIDISKTQFMEDLVNAIDWQLKEIGIEPSTQKSVPKEHSEEKKEDTQEDLPF